MFRALSPETITRIRELDALGIGPTAIGKTLGVSKTSAVTHRAPRPREPDAPLYDPRRDGIPEQDLTARVMGDPYPGRRELVAANLTAFDNKPHPGKQRERWAF